MVRRRRFVAAAIDSLALLVASYCWAPDSWGWLFMLLQLPYSLSEWLWRATPGKWLLGLAVHDQSGAAASGWQLIGRWLLRNNAILLVLLSFSGVPFLLFSPLGQGLFALGCLLVCTPTGLAGHDLLTDTCVRLSDRRALKD